MPTLNRFKRETASCLLEVIVAFCFIALCLGAAAKQQQYSLKALHASDKLNELVNAYRYSIDMLRTKLKTAPQSTHEIVSPFGDTTLQASCKHSEPTEALYNCQLSLPEELKQKRMPAEIKLWLPKTKETY